MPTANGHSPGYVLRQDEGEDDSKGWRYNRRTHRYRTPDGRYASATQARTYLDGYLADLQRRNADETRRYYRGEISQDRYLDGMRQRLKDGHITARAMGVGGRSAMTTADLAAINQHYSTDVRYAHRLAALIEAEDISEAEAARRAELYAGGRMRRGLDDGMRAVRGEDGWEQGRRVLSSGAKHCPTCLSEAAQGWQPIERCGEIGATDCQAADLCYFDYRYSPHQEDPELAAPWPTVEQYKAIVQRKVRSGIPLRGTRLVVR